MAKPLQTEYPEGIYFSRYIESVDNENVIETLKQNATFLENFYKNLENKIQNYKYAAGKWTLKEVLGHLTDTERIFCFRALAIARGEKQSLPGFDENEYMEFADFANQSLASLLNQYKLCRLATLALFESFSEEVQSNMGTANGKALTEIALPLAVPILLCTSSENDSNNAKVAKRHSLY